MFCTVKGLKDLGIAKLLDEDSQNASIEFFDSPAEGGRITRTVARADVHRLTLGANTRVYYYDPHETCWQVGRVLDDGDDSALIRFAHKSDREISHDDLFVRWRRPICDPTAFLSHGVTETPQYADARSDFLSSYITQRAAAGGISALLSSTIELEAHQIRVVRRILNDASQRYLLADEVGLGKTIEAGIIIRQAVLDDLKTHRVVVVVPESLIEQWRTELSERFGLRDLIDDSIRIHGLQDRDEIESSLEGATMLVIDEAHHLSALGDESAMCTYAMVSRHAASIDRLLLLSATPALRNEASFLRMLHLLDPLVYRLEDVESFKHRILHRQSLAEAVAFLDPQNALSLDPVLDDLARKLSTDTRLQALIQTLRTQLLTFPEADDPELERAIVLLRVHLSETYRLHRRVLRNRRKRLRFITPERSGSDAVMVRGWRASPLESLLEDWRLHASAFSLAEPELIRELEAFYYAAASALLENPRNLHTLCDARLQSISGAQTRSFLEEAVLLQRICDAVADDDWLLTRVQKLIEVVRSLVASGRKLVVFCAEEATADAVASHLERSRVTVVARHRVVNDESASWRTFQTHSPVKILVCGPTAEEGLNLQGSERAVIHFDLPLAPNRIEQRMGRVDRYGSGATIRSVVLLDEGSQLQLGWYRLLSQGLGVFRRSIASMQYLLEDEVRALQPALFREGSECFDRLLAEYDGPAGKVARELQLLDEQDALDELAPDGEADSEALEETDSDWRPISESVIHWAVDALLFNKIPEADAVGQRAPDPPYRFRYQQAKSSGQATLIPLAELLSNFLGALDVEARGSSASHPLTYKYLAHRKTAVTRNARVLRYGDVFIDALKSFSDVDDRGRSFGMWRQHVAGPESGFALYFRFDFLVEAQLEPAERCLEQSGLLRSSAARAAIKRRGDGLFSPTTVRVWIDEDGGIADSQLVATSLSLPYSRDLTAAEHTDTNLSTVRFHKLKHRIPEIFDQWPVRCARMRTSAESFVLSNPTLLARREQALKAAAQESALREAQLAARIHSLPEREARREKDHLQVEVRLDEALRAGISHPSVRLDVVGFMILSRQPYSLFAEQEEEVAA